MKVRDLMTTLVGTCRAFDGADSAARVMWEQDCGSVPVVDEDGAVQGMVTDRDLCMAAYTQGRALRDIRVSSAMSEHLWWCRPDDDVDDAARLMREHQVRRLPVVGAGNRLVGIVSLSDLAREARVEGKARVRKRDVAYAGVGKTLGAISSPSARQQIGSEASVASR